MEKKVLIVVRDRDQGLKDVNALPGPNDQCLFKRGNKKKRKETLCESVMDIGSTSFANHPFF